MLIRVILLCLTFYCQSLTAVEVNRLYEAEVIAESDSFNHRKMAIQQALSIVLTRILVGPQF